MYKTEKKEIKTYIKLNRNNVLKDKKISKRDRVSLMIFIFGDFIFKLSWILYKRFLKYGR